MIHVRGLIGVQTNEQRVAMAETLGFANAAMVATKDIPFEPNFLICCEENLCGKYGKNYACPPDCGTTDQMRLRIQSHDWGLLVQTIWEIDDPMDGAKTKQAKGAHNRAMFQLIDALRSGGDDVAFMIGASGCNLCTPCAIEEGETCRIPEKQFSCMSAYCVHVQELADSTGMEYDCGPGLVAFFGMVLFAS